MIVAGRAGHVREIADFRILAQNLGTHEQMNRMPGELFPEALDRRNGGIMLIVDSKNDFILRVLLQAVTAKALIHFRVFTLQRLQYGDWRQVFRGALA